MGRGRFEKITQEKIILEQKFIEEKNNHQTMKEERDALKVKITVAGEQLTTMKDENKREVAKCTMLMMGIRGFATAVLQEEEETEERGKERGKERGRQSIERGRQSIERGREKDERKIERAREDKIEKEREQEKGDGRKEREGERGKETET